VQQYIVPIGYKSNFVAGEQNVNPVRLAVTQNYIFIEGKNLDIQFFIKYILKDKNNYEVK